MSVVLDASAAIELVLRRPHSQAIAKTLRQADRVVVPDLYIAEVSNAMWKIESSASSSTSTRELLDDALSLPDEVVPSIEICHEAYALSIKSAHPVYDALYAITARQTGSKLITLDRKLSAIAEAEGLAVLSP